MDPLRIGVALADPEQPGPAARAFLDLAASDPRLAIVALIRCPERPARAGAAGTLMALEERLLGPRPRLPAPAWDAAAPVPIVAAGSLPPLDAIADLTQTGAPAAPCPPLGLWRLSSCDPLAGFAPAAAGLPASAVVLTCRTEGPALPVAEARYGTKFLAAQNRRFLREKSVQLLHRELARLALERRLPVPLQEPPDPAQEEPPARVARYLARAVRAAAGRLGARLARRRGARPGLFVLRAGLGDALDFEPERGHDILPPEGRYWADPFLFVHDGRTWLFFEDFDYATGRGSLGVGTLENGRFTSHGPALERPHHLSFPFVFAHEGEIWMIPETHEAGRVEVLRATDFPTGWEVAATALEGVRAVDTVLHREEDGQWWLFTNICRDSFDDFCSELHLFRVDGPLLGNPQPHPLNPVVIDGTTARGGGRVFRQSGMLLRASQDNSHGVYGWGLNLMEITRLDRDGYAERRIRHVTPDLAPEVMGCHHFDAAGGQYVIDLRLHRPPPPA